MLSPGTWWKRVPKSPRENLQFRKWLIGRCHQNKRNREAVIDACHHDLLFFVNAFVWTHHPKARPRVVPFISWDFQDKKGFRRILDKVDAQRDLVYEKARDMGATWIFCVTDFWIWLTEERSQSLLVSREGDMVDGKSPDAIFPKIDFIAEHLPEWLLPKGWNPDKHRLKRYMENPQNHATITGQATTEKIGIGGRASVMFLDEFSRVGKDREVLDGTADTSDCRIFNSTHNGTGTAFYKLTTNPMVDKEIFHWSMHPKKNKGLYRFNPDSGQIEILDKSFDFDSICYHNVLKTKKCLDCERTGPRNFEFVYEAKPAGGPFPLIRSPWYDDQCRRRSSSRAIAEDLDINPSASAAQVFDEIRLRYYIRVNCREPDWQGDVTVDRQTGRVKEFIRFGGGFLKLWCPLNDGISPPPAPYAMGADVSTGSGATPSCLSIGNCKTGEKVAEYTNARIGETDLAPVATALCYAFSDVDGTPAKMGWEVPGPGMKFGGKVIELGFRRIYFKTTQPPHTMEIIVSDRPGWQNDGGSQRELLIDYVDALFQGLVTNPSEPSVLELLNFRYNATGNIEHAEIASKDDAGGAKLNHGDHAISDGIMWMLVKERNIMAIPGVRRVTEPYPFMSIGWMREQAEKEEDAEALWHG